MKTNLSAVKMSKRARKALDAQARGDWNGVVPVTRVVPDKRPTTAAGRAARIGRSCCRSNKRCKKNCAHRKAVRVHVRNPILHENFNRNCVKNSPCSVKLLEIDRNFSREWARRCFALESERNEPEFV